MVLNMAILASPGKNSLKRLSKRICDCLRDCLCRFRVNSKGRKLADFGWIRKGKKLADFEQKPWAIAHGFEHGRFWQVLEFAPNSLKRLQNRSKMICDCLRDCLCRFRVNSEGSKIGRFRAKGLGYSPWFWTWSILASPGIRSKLSETPAKPF